MGDIIVPWERCPPSAGCAIPPDYGAWEVVFIVVKFCRIHLGRKAPLACYASKGG